MYMKQFFFILSLLFLSAQLANSAALQIEKASDAQRVIIQTALGDHYPISEIVAVKSGNHPRAYYVGAKFHAEGVGYTTGIWIVSGDKDAPKLVFSVDGGAFHFSGMRRASETKAYATIADPEAKALNKYFRENR